MAYDDDSRFTDPRDWIEMLQSYFSLPENLTVGQLSTVLGALGNLSMRRSVRELTIFEVEETLRQHKMGGLPIGTAVELLQAIEPYAGKEDVLSHLSFRQIEEILVRARNR